ncbi:MAG: hypothetical protein JAZ17_12120 [Candidatus Thiodiazotropha endolucinida]|nr:hypothetical protein [Candidatus Thiodiazotropha endolucinida]
MLNKHDELLLRDLKLQPLWLLWLYIMLGLCATLIGLQITGVSMESLLCIGGGFLIALGAEKLVSRRIRNAAMQTVKAKQVEREGKKIQNHAISTEKIKY